jgi:hypothetical protein
MLQNLNVFFPLADLCLGTFRSAASVAAKSKPGPEPAPEQGEAAASPSARPVKPLRRKQAERVRG